MVEDLDTFLMSPEPMTSPWKIARVNAAGLGYLWVAFFANQLKSYDWKKKPNFVARLNS